MTLPGSGGGAAVRRRMRRLQQLEGEVAMGKAERAELRRRLEVFEAIAAAAGASADGARASGGWRHPVPAAPMPPGLAAAARELRSHDTAVRLDVAGADLVAVVGGPGDPREWWTAIWQLAGPETTGPGLSDPAPADPAPADPAPAASNPASAGPAPAGPEESPA